MPMHPARGKRFPRDKWSFQNKWPQRIPKPKEPKRLRKITPLAEALTPAQKIRFWRNFLQDQSNVLFVERRKRNRLIMSRELKAGNVISQKISNTHIFYNSQYKKFASRIALRFGRKLEPIVIRGQPTPDGTIARNTVYKVVVRNISMARKTYIDVIHRVHSGLSEACALLEAKRRGIPVVDFVRLVLNKKSGLAILYTIMPAGYKTLANSKLGRDAPASIFLRALGKAVGQMHKKGMLHGDLDAENILWNGHDLMFLDLELARFFERQPSFSQVAGDIGVLIESLTLERYGPLAYSEDELMHFVKAYCEETGYSQELVLGLSDSAIQPLANERESLRKSILRRLGLEE